MNSLVRQPSRLTVEEYFALEETSSVRHEYIYRAIESLRAYYVVHQDRPKVEQHWLDEDGVWWDGTLFREGTLHVPCLDLDLPLADIYEGVSFDEAAAPSDCCL